MGTLEEQRPPERVLADLIERHDKLPPRHPRRSRLARMIASL
jgi:hypothetical protein